MGYRKYLGDWLFDGYRFWADTVLVMTDDGAVETLLPATEAGEGVQEVDGIITPGLVNCHCHLELSHMKGKIPERSGLVDFVYKVVTERGTTEEEILSAVADAESKMVAEGVVAVGDICNNASTLQQKQQGNLRYYNFIEASGWLPSVSAARFERAKGLFDVFEGIPNSEFQILNSIVPHAPYSVSENLWTAIQPYFKNKVAAIHNQETAFEDEFFMKGTGDFTRMYELMKIDNGHHRPTLRSSLQSYFNKLAGAEKLLLVHNTFTRHDDVDYVNGQLKTQNPKPETFFCLCPNANLYIEGVLPPVDMFRDAGCNVVLGTDSLASNHGLSVVAEMKTLRKHFPHISLEEMLRWATLNGARALGMEDALGSFEKGKKPGVVLLSADLSSVRPL